MINTDTNFDRDRLSIVILHDTVLELESFHWQYYTDSGTMSSASHFPHFGRILTALIKRVHIEVSSYEANVTATFNDRSRAASSWRAFDDALSNPELKNLESVDIRWSPETVFPRFSRTDVHRTLLEFTTKIMGRMLTPRNRTELGLWSCVGYHTPRPHCQF